MEMDRQTLSVFAAAALALALLTGYFFAPAARPSADTSERPAYSVEDIRYKYRQAELKEKKKNKGHRAPQASASEPSGDISDSSDGGESANEEPSLDHEPQEEPPIE